MLFVPLPVAAGRGLLFLASGGKEPPPCGRGSLYNPKKPNENSVKKSPAPESRGGILITLPRFDARDHTFGRTTAHWLWRGEDSNLRPRGYEPRELPTALPHFHDITFHVISQGPSSAMTRCCLPRSSRFVHEMAARLRPPGSESIFLLGKPPGGPLYAGPGLHIIS